MIADRSAFPIAGVVGVIGGPDDEVGRQLTRLESLPALGGVEIRADLFETCAAGLALTERLKDRWPVLFTVRLAAEGGAWRDSESRRIEIYSEALRRGAVLLDAELRSGAARALSEHGAPLLVSHHDFDGPIGPDALEELTAEAASLAHLGIKIVPTAARPLDALRTLQWVAARKAGGPRRIGFAMGDHGVFSRILTPAWGAPFTYGSLTVQVAPGQLSARDLLDIYRAPAHTRATRVFGVIGSPVHHSLSPYMHNPAFAARGLDAIYVPFALRSFSDLWDLAEPLAIAGVSVTIPFKKDAFDHATSADAASEAGGVSNTLVWERSEGAVALRGWNTDANGVLEPLARRRIELAGLSVGILGNGGAARGAAGALLAAGASVTLYYRNKEKGESAASDLGCAARPMDDLAPRDHGLLVNATPLGLDPRDASPVASRVFTPETIAFDMIYDPPDTPFLRCAAQAGAQVLIPGREMLVCQGLVQFRLFTGEDATYDEFEASFLGAQKERRGKQEE